MIVKIVTEVYETVNDDWAALVVFYDVYGDRVSYVKKFFKDRFSAVDFAFTTVFKDRNLKEWSEATYKSSPGRRDYELIVKN